MKTIEEMNQWSYKQAYTFFYETNWDETSNTINEVPEVASYLLSVKAVQTFDLRSRPEYIETALYSRDYSNTLIFIDGPSCSGKSTLAERIANRIDAEIVDIDLICLEWFNKKLELEKNPFKRNLIIDDMKTLTDEYLLNNIEEIIIQKSKMNKPVILVGMYLSLLFRTIVVKTLGRYFNDVTSIFCFEESFGIVKKLIDSRNKDFKQEIVDNMIYNSIYEDYLYAKMIVEEKNGLLLGAGMNLSFIVDTKVSDQIK